MDAVHDPQAGFVTLEEEQWGHVYRLCVNLAEQLTRREQGSPKLEGLLRELSDCQVRARSLEHELDLLRIRNGEVYNTGQQRQAQLRAAVSDLTQERTRQEQDPAVGPAPLADLNYQIGQLEQRLTEVERETQKALRHSEHVIARHDQDLEGVKSEQLGMMLRLIGELRTYQPQRLSADIAKLWRAIEALLPG
jgi:chromosome segregation ATPase